MAQETATGGVNVRQTEYVANGTTTRTLCELKWRATNTLTIETSSMAALPDLQDSLLSSIDATVVDPTATAQTYAELTAPTFALRDATMHTLRAKAQETIRAELDVPLLHGRFSRAPPPCVPATWSRW